MVKEGVKIRIPTMKWRVGIVTSKGRIEALNFDTREQVDDFILSFQGEEQITHYRIEQEGILIETERGKQ